MTDAQAETIAKLLAELSRQLSDTRKSHGRIEQLLADILSLLRSREAVVTVPHSGTVSST